METQDRLIDEITVSAEDLNLGGILSRLCENKKKLYLNVCGPWESQSGTEKWMLLSSPTDSFGFFDPDECIVQIEATKCTRSLTKVTFSQPQDTDYDMLDRMMSDELRRKCELLERLKSPDSKLSEAEQIPLPRLRKAIKELKAYRKRLPRIKANALERGEPIRKRFWPTVTPIKNELSSLGLIVPAQPAKPSEPQHAAEPRPKRKRGMGPTTRKRHKDIWDYVQKRQRIAEKECREGRRDSPTLTQDDLVDLIRTQFQEQYGQDYPSTRTLRTIIKEGEAGLLK